MIRSEKGQILILVFIALGIVLFTALFIIAGSQLYYQNATYSSNTEKATALAEAGIDKALASLNSTAGAYNGEAETFFGNGSYSVEITNKDAGSKIIKATGYIPDKTDVKAKKTVTIQVSKGSGISFSYGVQVGEGGITMGEGATVNGSVYSNGSITGGNNATITGDVYVAGAPQLLPDQQSECFDPNCQDYIFGKNTGGENRLDAAQSFVPSADGNLNKVSLQLKKTGSPANATVRIMNDAGGKPDKNDVLATGSLSADLVTNEYSFTDVSFNTTPYLTGGNTYWIMIDSASLNDLNYWIWSNDFASGYSYGAPKWSPAWNTGNPSWYGISGDLGFRSYMGGLPTSVDFGNNSIINGSVHANTISGVMTVSKDAFYQTLGPSVTVGGNKFPGYPDPAPAVFPISNSSIAAWQTTAENLGSGSSVSGCPSILGPGKINGSVVLGNVCNVKVVAPVWITGDLITGNSTKLNLDPDFGVLSGMIVVNGVVNFGNGSDITGSGTAGSYLMVLSTHNSKSDGSTAIETGNSSISGILYAPVGKVNLANGASFREVTAWQLVLGNFAALNYESGLASSFFSAGPSGTFSIVKGTYQIK